MRKSTWLLALAGGGLLLISAPAPAQKKGKELDEAAKAEIQHERMQKLIAAYDLAEQGRKKNAPEYLLTAAGMLRYLSNIPEMQKMKPSEVKPDITTDGKPAADEEIKAPTLSEQSDALFKDASDMAAGLGVNVDKLIKIAKEREDREERAVVGGPKQVARMIAGGHTHTFHYKLMTRAYSNWAYQSNLPLRVSVVRGDTDNPWFVGMTMHAARTWHPGWHPNPKQAPITIRIHNPTKRAARYQMVIQ